MLGYGSPPAKVRSTVGGTKETEGGTAKKEEAEGSGRKEGRERRGGVGLVELEEEEERAKCSNDEPFKPGASTCRL